MPRRSSSTLPMGSIAGRIQAFRGMPVLLDSDLAALYEIPTKRLNEQVRRNAERFPPDFAFQLDPAEWAALRSQIATSKNGPGGRRHRPWVFTEHGAVMAASVLNSPKAVQVSVFVVRAFVQMRRMASEVSAFARRLDALEQETARRFQDQDGKLKALFQALRDLLDPTKGPAPPAPVKRPIGFRGQGR